MPTSDTHEKIHFDSLDGLRGVAALGVALFHWLMSFYGYLAVDFFLVLSGFILAHRYLYAAKPVPALNFASARIARLYPMHLFTLIAYLFTWLALSGSMPRFPDGTIFTFVQHLTLTQNIGLNSNGLTWNAPSWSISVELWLNLLFICCITRKTSSITLIILSVASLVIIYRLTGHLDTHYQNYFQVLNSGLLRGWASFALGIVTYRAWLKLRTKTLPSKLLIGIEFICILAIAGLLYPRDSNTHALDIFAPLIFACAVLVVALGRSGSARFLAKLKWLGTISYSVYLNQLFILLLVGAAINKLGYSPAPLAPLYIIILLAFSSITYRYIELPGKRIISNFSHRLFN